MGSHNELGVQGEQLAENHLKMAGYTVLCRNYRYLKAEIDIIALKGEVLTIVEVKTRSSDHIKPIAEAVDTKKIKLLALAADNYVLESEWDGEVRFDIITVLRSQDKFAVNHIENAFFPF
ncbi:MAG: endonuclease [Eudoraea sp.]|nr:YraN family protein [Muriicola sp.]NNE01639.1 endonuclease [Eudoraea sp.]